MTTNNLSKEEIETFTSIGFAILVLVILRIITNGIQDFINKVIIPFTILILCLISLAVLFIILVLLLASYLDQVELFVKIAKLSIGFSPSIVAIVFSFLVSKLAIFTLSFIGINGASDLVGLLTLSPVYF